MEIVGAMGSNDEEHVALNLLGCSGIEYENRSVEKNEELVIPPDEVDIEEVKH